MVANTRSSFVQVAPDSTGKKISNLEIHQTNPDTGNDQIVNIQVVAISDSNGNINSGIATEQTMQDILEALMEIKELLQKVI